MMRGRIGDARTAIVARVEKLKAFLGSTKENIAR